MNILEKFEELKRSENAMITDNVEFTTIVEDLFYVHENELDGEPYRLEYHAFGEYRGVLGEFFIDKYGELVVDNQSDHNSDVILNLDMIKSKYTVIEIPKEGE